MTESRHDVAETRHAWSLFLPDFVRKRADIDISGKHSGNASASFRGVPALLDVERAVYEWPGERVQRFFVRASGNFGLDLIGEHFEMPSEQFAAA